MGISSPISSQGQEYTHKNRSVACTFVAAARPGLAAPRRLLITALERIAISLDEDCRHQKNSLITMLNYNEFAVEMYKL